MKRAFILTFTVTLILFFTVFGLCESYIAMQNTMSKDKITSPMEAFIDKEKNKVEIHLFGKEFLKFHTFEVSIPYEFSAFVPPYIRLLWIATKEISPTKSGGYLFILRFSFLLFQRVFLQAFLPFFLQPFLLFQKTFQKTSQPFQKPFLRYYP